MVSPRCWRHDRDPLRGGRDYCWWVLIAEYSSGAHQRQTRFRCPR
ncbi:hypothetical protein SGUI_0019 [Serinicoccus hydrothermalis]|uniref:Uncharacterized protein n=1 Tax=Serinicoccus hydrothermalis TaxID=1758689 RepID=A0A1B1N7Q0_9MICO|nr:hypothetical protein SGUI_0019 [Serinicoccus hydrothermalis]